MSEDLFCTRVPGLLHLGVDSTCLKDCFCARVPGLLHHGIDPTTSKRIAFAPECQVSYTMELTQHVSRGLPFRKSARSLTPLWALAAWIKEAWRVKSQVDANREGKSAGDQTPMAPIVEDKYPDEFAFSPPFDPPLTEEQR